MKYTGIKQIEFNPDQTSNSRKYMRAQLNKALVAEQALIY